MNQTDLDSLSQEEIRSVIPKNFIANYYISTWEDPDTIVKLVMSSNGKDAPDLISPAIQTWIFVENEWKHTHTFFSESKYYPINSYGVIINNIVNILRNRKINEIFFPNPQLDHQL